MRYVYLALLWFIVFLPGCYNSTSSYVARVLAIHGFDVHGEIVSARVLSEDTSNLGSSGHMTVQLLLTDVGFETLLSKTSQDDVQRPAISGFGTTLLPETASHTYFGFSETGREFVVILADEASRIAEVVIAW